MSTAAETRAAGIYVCATALAEDWPDDDLAAVLQALGILASPEPRNAHRDSLGASRR